MINYRSIVTTDQFLARASDKGRESIKGYPRMPLKSHALGRLNREEGRGVGDQGNSVQSYCWILPLGQK